MICTAWWRMLVDIRTKGGPAVKVAEILRSKGANVLTVERAVSLRSALERMAVSGVGALVVTGPDGSMVGIVSERDVVRALATSGATALDAAVEDVMTREVIDLHPRRQDHRADGRHDPPAHAPTSRCSTAPAWPASSASATSSKPA